jgi:Ca2+-binding RTX toxin-like protein
MPTNITTWLKFALQQMAAESYLDGINLLNEDQVRLRLSDGNNDTRIIQPDPITGELPGKTRFTNVLADRFLSTYDIIDHHANDASGFSATLMRDTTTGEYTLSFRSTEFKPAALGGDKERDALQADADIGLHGFAFGQLAAMEEYFARLKQGVKSDGTIDPTLQAFFAIPGHVINVTGYSLGGHLATVFTELHESEVAQTYIFNGSGRGHVLGADSSLAAEEARIQAMLQYFGLVLNDPDAADPGFSRDNSIYEAASTSHATDPGWDPFDQGAANFYSDPRYQWAKAATLAKFNTEGTASIELTTNFLGEPKASWPFSKITALYGLATTGDLIVVAISGVHAAGAQPIYIEGQPLVEGYPWEERADFGNTHSLTLLVDSLAVQELIQTIDGRYGQASAELLIKASSNSRAEQFAPLNAPGVVEGDSLEKTVDALRKLFRDPALSWADPLSVDSRVGGFGNLANRNAMYQAMQEVKDRVDALKTQQPGVVFTIDDLTSPTVTGPAIAGIADTDTDQGLAYRYALKELNPFAVLADTPQANEALYAGHNGQGELDRFNEADGSGTLTSRYIDDRALFLKEKVALNQLDRDTSSRNLYFLDVATGYEIKADAIFQTNRQFLFGSDNAETLTGGSKNDEIFGGDGVDTLLGNGGNDYLQGDAGNDTLNGGSGADRMHGGQGNDTYIVDDLGDQVIEIGDNGSDTVETSVQFSLVGTTVEDLTLTGTDDIDGNGNDLDNLITGNAGINRLDGKGGTDHLIGGLGNDILLGGAGENDLLEGGIGFDTYIYASGDGNDTIEDVDAQGIIIVDGQALTGGIKRANESTWKSSNGAFEYRLEGGHLKLAVNGSELTINENFQSGQFGIQLLDAMALPTELPTTVRTIEGDHLFLDIDPTQSGVQTGSDDLGNPLLDLAQPAETPDTLRGSQGNDTINGGASVDYVMGFGGDDVLISGSGVGLTGSHDDLLGGDGNDVLFAGEPINIGGLPSLGSFIGTETTRVFSTGELGDDVLVGGAGGDILFGGGGKDLMLGGAGDDFLDGDDNFHTPLPPSGWGFFMSMDPASFDYSHVGLEHVTEISSSFGGDDEIHAGAGNDLVWGWAGNDLLYGDAGDDRITAGAGDDAVFGGAGNDNLQGDEIDTVGNDFLDGGAGDDVVKGSAGDDTVLGGAGNDQLYGEAGNLLGVAGADFLDGGDGNDFLYGNGGNDVLFGGAGDDQLFGDFSNDTVPGNDTLYGEEGNDLLAGEAGNDMLDGGEDDDELQGGEGDDFLFGGNGDDRLFGQVGDDMLSGEEGIDALSGGEGDDTLFGDEENDTLLGDEGNDTILGGLGDDGLRGGVGDDVLDGGAGNDFYVFHLGDGHDVISDGTGSQELNELVFGPGIALANLAFVHDAVQQILTIQINGGSDSIQLLGVDLNNVAGTTPVKLLSFADGTQVALADQLPLPNGFVQGDEGDETIRTGPGDDVVDAQAGNDSVFTGAGNDVLLGGSGNDTLFGGAGQDTYVFNVGDGVDSISDLQSEGNRVVFGLGVTSASLSLGIGPSGAISVRVAGTADMIQLPGVSSTGASVDTFEFQDGSVVAFSELAARGVQIGGTISGEAIFGTELKDIIHAGSGNDFVDGQSGSDDLFGEEGDDQLRGGSGNDVLNGGSGDDVLHDDDGADLLLGGAGNDIYEVFQPSQQIIELAGEGVDTIRTAELPSHTLTLPDNVENGEMLGDFAASMSFVGNALDNQLRGPRLLDGQSGNDLLIGEGDNVYIFGRGYGVDIIRTDVRQFYALTGQDEVQLLPGVSPGDLTLSGHANNLVLTINGTTDQLIVESYLVPPSDQIDQIQFADGTTWTYADITNRVFLLTGTSQNETLLGFNNDNDLRAMNGNDQVFGVGGNDILDGGQGDDILIGGEGNDTYLFGLGSGQDAINNLDDNFNPDDIDTLALTGSLLPSDITLQATLDAGLLLQINGSTDHVLLENYLRGGMFQIDQIQFADGSMWDLQAIADHAQGLTLVGTEDFDFLSGFFTRDTLSGLGGDDTIVGNEGDDLLFGGDGGDTLEGGLGNDTLHGEAGDDVLYGGLGPNSGGEGGEGGGGQTGDLGNDALVGGTGNDTYLFNLGDGIDTIEDVAVVGEGNRIQFGVGVAQSDLALTHDEIARTLTIQVGASGTDQLVLTNFDPTGANGSLVVETLAFADGSEVNLASLLGPTITIFGTENADVLVGTVGNDGIDAGAGNDTVYANGGNDLVLAGEGDDVVTGDEGMDTISGGGGIDYLYGGADNDVINGDDGNDTLVGDVGNDVLTGGLGNDVLSGGLGDDVLAGEVGNDAFYGGAGNDLISGGAGDDSVSGEDGADTILGGSGTDYLYGGDGDDVINGDEGNDTIIGEAGNDVLTGGTGNDVLNGGAGADQLNGGAGDDSIYVDAADTVVNGGAGYDSVTVLGTEAVTLNATTAQIEFAAGSNGSDIFTAVGSLSNVTFYGGEGNDQLTGGDGNDVLVGQVGNDTLTGGLGDDILSSGEGDDVLTGEAGNDAVYAGAGNDVINGGAGDDSVSGDEGADTISGGSGTDYLYGGEGDDVIDGDEGNDTLVGEIGNDVLRGGAGNDVISGGAGADQLLGGDGDDSLYIDAADTVVNGGAGYDSVTVLGLEAATLDATAAQVELAVGSSGNDVFTATGSVSNVTFYGGDGNDHLTGGDGNDVLIGQAGDDTLTGGLGNDVFNGGEGADVLTGEAGNDAFYAGAGNDLINGGEGDDSVSGEDGADTISGGSGQDSLYGGEGDDIINGDEGNDVLVGNSGNDMIAGGLGNDYLVGGTGNDQYTFARGDGGDTISEDDSTVGNSDRLLFGNTINPLDLVVSRQANDLRLAIHGTSEQVVIENWYVGDAHQVENVQAGNGQTLLNTQVDQLIQAMAAFSQQSGLTWDQAIDQRPQDVQTVLAASWQ